MTGKCWVSNYATNTYGYVQIKTRDEYFNKSAHRVAYEILVEPIPEGLQLDHLCRNRACYNPKHLEAVTGRENRARGITDRPRPRTHCPHGHIYDEQNTYINTKGAPVCRQCKRDRHSRKKHNYER